MSLCTRSLTAERLVGFKRGPTGFARISLPILTKGFLRPFWCVNKPVAWPDGSGILVQPALIDVHFRKLGCQIFVVMATWTFYRNHLPKADFIELPILTEEAPHEAAMLKKPLLVVWMAGHGMKLWPLLD